MTQGLEWRTLKNTQTEKGPFADSVFLVDGRNVEITHSKACFGGVKGVENIKPITIIQQPEVEHLAA